MMPNRRPSRATREDPAGENGTGPDDSSERRRPGREDFAQLRRLLGYTKPYRGGLVAGIAAVAIAGGLSLLFPLIIRDLLNTAFAPDATRDTAVPALDRTAALLFGLMLVQAVFNFVRTYSLGRVGEAVVADLRKALFGHVLTLDVDFFNRRKTGEITSRLTSDIATVQAAVAQALAQLVNQSITLLGGIVVLFLLEARLTLVMMAVVPPVVLAAAFFGRRLRRLSTRFQDRLAAANATAEEAIAGIRVVKSFTAERVETERYSSAIDGSFQAALARVKVRAFFTPAVILAVFAGLAIVLWYGGRLALAGDLLGGDLVAFLLITMFVAGSLGSFTGLYAQLQEAIGASKRIFELLDLAPVIGAGTTSGETAALRAVDVDGDVVFDGVSFSYGGRGDEPVLDSIDLTARSGDVVAIVGPSGAGKSTMAALLPRFYDPTAGSITIDGIDVRSLDLEELRSHIGIVPQETTLFSGSVAENIRYGRPTAGDGEVIQAARDANAHDFISAFPEGYATTAGAHRSWPALLAERLTARLNEIAAAFTPDDEPDPDRLAGITGSLGSAITNREQELSPMSPTTGATTTGISTTDPADGSVPIASPALSRSFTSSTVACSTTWPSRPSSRVSISILPEVELARASRSETRSSSTAAGAAACARCAPTAASSCACAA